MCRNRSKHEILLALNGAFAKSVDEIREQFASILPHDAIRVFTPLPDVNSLDDNRAVHREASAMAWEAFIASLEPDLVHVSSLFEGLSDDAVTSIGAHGFGRHLTAVTLFDLIPLINKERYLSNPVIDRWYRRKIEHISRADLLLSISESSRQEALEYLNFTQDEVVNISTAADDQFREHSVDAASAKALREKHGINRQFIMYTGGIDYRKNIEGLIEAYALLPANIRKKFALAVVCSCQPADKERLLLLAKQNGLSAGDLVMTGYVTEDDLIGLYRTCKVFIFPSWHEGFGLPALEAMWCGAPVIGSNRSSLPEVIGWDEAMFDPHDNQAIADKLQQVLTDDAFARALVEHGAKQRLNFSWDKSAKIALTAFEKIVEKRGAKKVSIPAAPPTKPRLAYVSPVPPARSGIADYSAELVPVLTDFYDIDLVVPDDFDTAQTDGSLRNIARDVLPARKFRANKQQYDRVLYHFGNSDHHIHMFGLLEEIPGVVVLHDFFLSGVLSYWEQHLKNAHVWSQALYESHGYQALAKLGQPGGIEGAMWEYPSNRRVLDQAQGVIVHSENSRRLASKWVSPARAERFFVIPHLRVPDEKAGRNRARQRLGFKTDDILICSFGIMGRTKHVGAVLDGWLASKASNDRRVHLVFVGQRDSGDLGDEIDAKIAASGKSERIHITGWTDLPEFRDYLRAADIAIQLRTLSRGETSGTILDCMNYALPIIVNANGAMADLPEDCVVKLDDEFRLEDLVTAIDSLAESKERRTLLGNCGRKLIKRRHNPEHCAALYRDAIEAFWQSARAGPLPLAGKIQATFGEHLTNADCVMLSERIDWNAATVNDDGRVLIEVPEGGVKSSEVATVLRAIVADAAAPRIEPVYWSAQDLRFRYARKMMLRLLGHSEEIAEDDVVDFRIGDQFFALQDGLRTELHDDAIKEIRRRVGIAYFKLVQGRNPPMNFTLPDSARVVLKHFMAAGWHPDLHKAN